MTKTKAVRVSLLLDAVRSEAFAEASRFLGEFYECVTARRDELFELVDAVLCADGPVKSPVDLTLLPEHRRGHGAMYGGLNHGRIDVDRLRTVLAGLPLPRFDGWRLVLAVDVSRGCGRTRRARPIDFSVTSMAVRRRRRSSSRAGPTLSAVLEPGATSWTAILDAVRLGPVDDATAVTADQLRGVVERLIAAGQWQAGDPPIVIATDTINYCKAENQAWDRVHPRLTHRSSWLDHDGDLPLVEGTLIRLRSSTCRKTGTPHRCGYGPPRLAQPRTT
ncbi:transposase [Streptomyces griseus]|uniref:transposase n=1 Tax=Streptomyces TaxID=1883 RepID=UPI0037A7E37E|nr:transposase [Streptomyces griseus]WTD65927.1 transposase [Streptomyces griseus]